jgi:hypothetical protein
MKSIVNLTILCMLFCAGCDHDFFERMTPVKPVSELPVFTKQVNEIEIADSFNNTDPTMVLGAIVERSNGLVHSFDSFLKDNAKVERKAISEIVFRDFLENSVLANAEWLTFLKGQVNDSTRAEVSVTEVSNASFGISSIDKDKLQKFTQGIEKDKHDDYGVVIAYRDFVISAGFFKEQAIEGNVSGYGAKIGGKWFGKHEGLSADHKVIAVWSPLPFVIENVSSSDRTISAASLTALTNKALKDGKIRISPLDRRKQFKLRIRP